MDIFFKVYCRFFCNFDNIFTSRPGYTKVVPGEGMPVSADPTKKGDLVIEFDIEFPTSLTPDRKDLIKKALLH